MHRLLLCQILILLVSCKSLSSSHLRASSADKHPEVVKIITVADDGMKKFVSGVFINPRQIILPKHCFTSGLWGSVKQVIYEDKEGVRHEGKMQGAPENMVTMVMDYKKTDIGVVTFATDVAPAVAPSTKYGVLFDYSSIKIVGYRNGGEKVSEEVIVKSTSDNLIKFGYSPFSTFGPDDTSGAVYNGDQFIGILLGNKDEFLATEGSILNVTHWYSVEALKAISALICADQKKSKTAPDPVKPVK